MSPPGRARVPSRRRSRRLPQWAKVLRGLFTRDWKGLVTAIVVLTFVMVAFSAATAPVPRSQMLAYDDDWDDLSDFRDDLGTLPLNITVRTVSSTVASLTDISDARGMLYMAIGVERPYTFAEWRAIRNFITTGGTVVIADDYGYGNSLLRFNGFVTNPAISHLGDTPEVQYVFSGERLADVQVDHNPLLVRLTVPIWEGLEYEVLLNDPSCFVVNEAWAELEPWEWDEQSSSPAVLVATSSPSGWLDEDRDGIRDPGEKAGEFPVMLYEAGMLLISDPSIFINDMYDRYDNRLFAQALIARMLPAGGIVIFDESVHREAGVLGELDDTIMRPVYRMFGESWPINTFFLVLLVGIGGMLLLSRMPTRRFIPHRTRLGEPRTLGFGHPYNWLADYYDVRGVMLQRLRYAYGLDPDDLQTLPPEMVARLMGDMHLAQFVLQPVRLDGFALQAAIQDIASWTPPSNADAIVEEADAFLASLRDGSPVPWNAGPFPPTPGGPHGGGWR